MSDTQAAPATATEARAELAARVADKDFGKRVLDGDVAAKKEIADLIAKVHAGGDDVVAAAMSGQLSDVQTSEQRLMAGTAEMLRDIGFPEKAIHETLAGKVPTPDDIQRAQTWKRQAMNSPEWVRRYLAGEPDARREMMAADVVITTGARAKALKEAAP